MIKHSLLVGAAFCGAVSPLWAQTYKDAYGTAAPSFVPLTGCDVVGKCAGPVSTTNPFPVVVTVGGAANSATNGAFVNPAAGATFPISGSVSTVANNPNAIYSGQQTCAITSAALPSQTLVNGVVIKALKSNTANVYIGGSAVTTASGYPLVAGEAISYAVTNLSAIYLICQNATDVVAITGN